MINEHIFTTEVSVPRDLDFMVNVSVNHDKLQEVMKFTIDMLKKHEKYVKELINSHQKANNEFLQVYSSQKALETKVKTLDDCVTSSNESFRSIEENLKSKHDTTETIKYLLEMVTGHDSIINAQKKEIKILFDEKSACTSKISELENTINQLSLKQDSAPSGKILFNRTSLIKPPDKNFEEFYRPRQIYNLKNINPNDFHISNSQVSGVKLLNPPDKKNHLNTDSKSLSPVPDEKNHKNHKKNQNFFEGLFPFPSKSYTQTESQVEIENENKAKHGASLHVDLKNIEKRLDTVERIVGNSDSNNLYNRLDSFESMLRFYTEITDSLGPDLKKNKNTVQRFIQKVNNLEKSLINKLNTEHFDPIKSLVIAIASGAGKKELPDIKMISEKDFNYLETLSQRLADLENNYFSVSKSNSLSIDDLDHKILKLEQKLELKSDRADLNALKKSLGQISDHYKALASNIETKKSSLAKPSDSSVISSLNRKFLELEETLKSFKLPNGVSLINMWEEIQRLWEGLKHCLTSLEAYGNLYDNKIHLLSQSPHRLSDLIRNSEEKLKNYCKSLTDTYEKKFADHCETIKGFKRIESLMDRLEKNVGKAENDDAMLAKKPLAGWSCGSCEKNLEKFNPQVAAYRPWSKLPARDAKEKAPKPISFYSSTLSTPLKIPKKNKNYANNVPGSQTDRSLTPTF
jgi:hypothetical protein